jgi:hypothetical protein
MYMRSRRRFLNRLFVGRLGGLGLEQRLSIRCLFVHRNAHVIDRIDDVFNLLRIHDLGGQVIVHLRIRQVALLLATGNEELELRLAIFTHDRGAALDTQRHLLLGSHLRGAILPIRGTNRLGCYHHGSGMRGWRMRSDHGLRRCLAGRRSRLRTMVFLANRRRMGNGFLRRRSFNRLGRRTFLGSGGRRLVL